ncbi:MAG: hypothetical protein H6574_22270 [Lewinellaceae bacterium]|nr:hypothetical protein [Saprospiraceae bacterium]MCB9333790.1 hypothetical protein [Lewinellaceae bacterium]
MKNKLFHFILLNLLALGGLSGLVAQNPEFPNLDPLPEDLDSLPEFTVKSFARNLANQALDIQAVFDRQASRATLEREVLDDQMAASKADTLATKEEREVIAKALKAAKSAEKSALKQQKKAAKPVELVLETAELDSADLRKNLPKAYKKLAALLPEPEQPAEVPIAEVIGVPAISDPETVVVIETPEMPDSTSQETSPEEPEQAKSKKEKKQRNSRPTIKTYDPATDVMRNPPPRPCVLTLDTRDAFSGELRRETGQEEIFRFTSPSLKTYFPDRDHIICHASLASNSGTYLLQLRFTINDANAQRAFGNLPRNGVAILRLFDGETYTLYNLRADEGKASEDKKQFTFSGQYVVEGGMLKKLRKTLLDKIRIAWSTGYEDYDVYNVDFLQRQLDCLQKD